VPYSEFAEPEKQPDWNELQKNLSPEAGLDDVSGFTENPMQKEAAFVGKELIQSELDSYWANSQLLNEALELEKHVQRLIDDKVAYVVLEKSLKQIGYQTPNIRNTFKKLTKIDPVRAYLDTANYPIPPGAVPRYNFGWGESKKADADYFFIMPHTDKYAIFKLKGLNTEIVSQHDMVDWAREDLKKHVKTCLDVTPDVADTLTDIVQKMSGIAQLSKKGASFLNSMRSIASQDLNEVSRAAINAVEEGHITSKDFNIIANELFLKKAGPEDLPLTAPERVDQRSFNEFQQNQEGRSFQEMKNNTLMPGQEFASNWESQHKVDFWGLLSESREMFQEISATVEGFAIEPSWGTFKIMPNTNLATDDSNHILDGSVAVGATVQKLGQPDQSEVAILMFIHGGKLKYSGKFKGVNNKEYALTTMGLEDYFSDLEGSSALEDKIDRGMPTSMQEPTMQPGPMSGQI